MYNFDENDRVFMWYDSGRMQGPYKNRVPSHPIEGPHGNHEAELIGGRAYYHKLEDLLKCNFSKTIQKRLNSAKEGTSIRIGYLHRGGNLCVVRLTEEQISDLIMVEKIKNDIVIVKEQIKEAVPELIAKRNELNSSLRKKKEAMKKMGLL